MNPTDRQLHDFQWHCAVMRATGAKVMVSTRKDIFGYSAAVLVMFNNKSYRFSDPDWNVITKQLATLVNSYAMN